MIIDHCEKTLSIKIVYFGPAFSGKTSSIKALFTQFGRGDAVYSIESTIDRTLFFDYGTVTFQNEEWKLKLHIYTTTGQDFYLITRLTTLRAVDGIIFVIDSDRDAFERNLLSWRELLSYFSEWIEEIPLIVAFNKQDLEEKFDPQNFLREINYGKYKKMYVKYTIAIEGIGILDCFEDILKLILQKYYKCKLISVLS
ncbi:MAG: ATP/GTP-binding protein [Promethearchaeota archaeon]